MTPIRILACLTILLGTFATAATGCRARRDGQSEPTLEQVSAIRAHADKGDAPAQSKLGGLYLHGDGVPEDVGEAARWYRKSAEQGNAEGEAGLAYLCYYGFGMPQDFAESLRWYQKAANQGLAQAQYSLGTLYFSGKGTPRDYTAAALWFRKAADQGDAGAETELGYMEFGGIGVPLNRLDGYRLYRKAAEQGNLRAQRALGMTTPNLGVWRVANLLILVIGSLFLLLRLESFGQFLHDRQSRIAAIVGFFGLLFVAFDYFGTTHIGELNSLPAAMAFYLCVGGVTGAYSAFLFIRFWSRFIRTALVVECILFALGSLSEISLYGVREIMPSICGFGSLNGVFIGASIPLVIWLWRSDRELKATAATAEGAPPGD